MDEFNVRKYFIASFGGIGFLVLLISIIWGGSALAKIYSVWSSAKDGEAQLAQATYNRQIAVKEAEAKSAAAAELAKAEVIRA